MAAGKDSHSFDLKIEANGYRLKDSMLYGMRIFAYGILAAADPVG